MQIFFKKGLRADVWCNLAVLIRVLYHPQILVYHFWLPHAIPQFLSWHPMMLYMLSVAPQRHWPSLYVTINSLKASIKSVVQVLRHKAIQCMSSCITYSPFFFQQHLNTAQSRFLCFCSSQFKDGSHGTETRDDTNLGLLSWNKTGLRSWYRYCFDITVN